MNLGGILTYKQDIICIPDEAIGFVQRIDPPPKYFKID